MISLDNQNELKKKEDILKQVTPQKDSIFIELCLSIKVILRMNKLFCLINLYYR